MKHLYLIALSVLFAFSAKSQILAPVKWSYGSKKTSKTTAIIFIKATMDNGWHIYSQHTPKDGPIKTTIKFVPSKTYTLNGKTIEPKPIIKFEKTFGMNVSYFEKTVIFQQKVNINTSDPTIKGTIAFMACDDTRCLPENTINFSIPIKDIS